MPLHRNYNNYGREALRGEGETIVDIISEAFTPNEWTELLETLLERAAARGARSLTHKLLDGVGLNMGLVLLLAVRGGHAELVDDLVKVKGAAVRSLDRHGNGPLHICCQSEASNAADILQTLLDAGVDKYSKNSGGSTPMYVASQNGHVAMGRVLVDAGVDVNLDCGFQRTALHIAAGRGHVDFIKMLFEIGVDVNERDGFQRTAIHHATSNCHDETIELLLEHGAIIDPGDNTGRTPIHDSAARLYRETLLVLLKHGANVNVQDGVGTTPVQFAALKAGKRGCSEIVEILLRAGADESIADDDEETALDVAGEYVDEEDRVAEDYDRVRSLLMNAPAERAWRRRGYMVLCRARPDRLKPPQDNSQTHAGTTQQRQSVCGDSGEPAQAVEGSQSELPGGSQGAPSHGGQSAPSEGNEDAPLRDSQGGAPEDNQIEPPDCSQVEAPDGSQVGTSDGSQDAPAEGNEDSPPEGGQGGPPEADQGGPPEADQNTPTKNSPVDEKAGWDWVAVTARVLGMQEEGLFRAIVRYL